MATLPVERAPAKPTRRKITPREALDRAQERIARRVLRYIAHQERIAEGIYIEELIPDPETEGRTTKRIVYQKPPDRQALQFLIDHGIGKAPQRYELTGEDGGAIEFMAWVPSNAPKDEDIIEGEAREQP